MSTTAWRLRQRSLELLDRLVRVTNLVLRLNSGISSRNQTPLFAQADLAADSAWPASYRESASVRSFAGAAPSTGWVANDLPFRAEPASGIVLVLVLRPKGQLRVPDQAHRPGSDGVTALGGWWQVVELWTLPAEPVLAAADPGMMPWVPLMHADEPPESVLLRCREVIDQHAPAEEHESLITVTQVFTRLRYKDPNLLSILGGKSVMIESLLIREIVAERRHKDILKVLAIRFGPVPAELEAEVKAILDESVLDAVVALAAASPDLEHFGAELRAIPRPPEPWDPADEPEPKA